MEIFKEIKWYEWKYQISNLGNVKSLISNKILKLRNRLDWYYQVALYKKWKPKEFLVNRLVW